MLAFSGRGEASRKQMATFLKTEIELSVYVYIKKVAEKEALLRRGDAIADFCFWKNRKDNHASYNQQGVFNLIESTILQSDVFRVCLHIV